MQNVCKCINFNQFMITYAEITDYSMPKIYICILKHSVMFQVDTLLYFFYFAFKLCN